MELAAKIIFGIGTWYLVGFLAMQYIKHKWNDGIDPTSSHYHKIEAREIFTLAICGVGIVIFIIIAEIHYQWFKRVWKKKEESGKWDHLKDRD